VIDIHLLSISLERACRALGVEIMRGTEVLGVTSDGRRVSGVRTNHAELHCEDVVLAAGAWCATLGERVDCPLPLTPIRRHLALLAPPRPLRDGTPAVWALGDEVYFRREGARVLASPCDETEWPSGAPQAELALLEPLWRKLSRIDSALAQASVARFWACLRTFAPDRRPVVGSDPRLEGLHWLGGLGGFGMTTGVAAAELLMRAVIDEEPVPEFAPERLLRPGSDAT
jgi:glycine/D-amino acid oxidase-like deaminating enzyme